MVLSDYVQRKRQTYFQDNDSGHRDEMDSVRQERKKAPRKASHSPRGLNGRREESSLDPRPSCCRFRDAEGSLPDLLAGEIAFDRRPCPCLSPSRCPCLCLYLCLCLCLCLPPSLCPGPCPCPCPGPCLCPFLYFCLCLCLYPCPYPCLCLCLYPCPCPCPYPYPYPYPYPFRVLEEGFESDRVDRSAKPKTGGFSPTASS
jgi:hypothetical protein